MFLKIKKGIIMSNLMSMKEILIDGFINKMRSELLNNPTEEKLLHLIKCINDVKDKCPDKIDFIQ